MGKFEQLSVSVLVAGLFLLSVAGAIMLGLFVKAAFIDTGVARYVAVALFALPKVFLNAMSGKYGAGVSVIAWLTLAGAIMVFVGVTGVVACSVVSKKSPRR